MCVFYPLGGGGASSSPRRTPSWSPAQSQELIRSRDAAGAGAVSARNRSIAAVTAAASSGEGAGVTSSILGCGGLRLSFVAIVGNLVSKADRPAEDGPIGLKQSEALRTTEYPKYTAERAGLEPEPTGVGRNHPRWYVSP